MICNAASGACRVQHLPFSARLFTTPDFHMSHQMRSVARWVAFATTLALALMAWVPTASAFEKKQQIVKIDGLVSVSPSRFEGDVTPGQPANIGFSVTNKTAKTLKIKLHYADLQPSRSSDGFVDAVEKAQFGASTWMQAERDDFILKSGEEAKQVVAVTPPLDAPVGDNFAAIIVEATEVTGGDEPKVTTAEGQKVAIRITGVVQFFFTVPGEIRHDTRILRTEVGDSFVVGSNRFVTYSVFVKNNGNVNDHVSGSVVVHSLFGNKVVEIPIRRQLLLRGSTREIRVLWTHPPFFGRFTGDVTLRTEDPDHPKIERGLPTVTILPPWWVLALVAASILGGIGYAMYHRNTAWKRYLDEDWDEDWDDEDLEDFDLGHS
jgi:hypothetical protein